MTHPDVADDQESADQQLSRLLAISDSSLGSLEIDELLDELLGRVAEMLVVDGATVLLLDDSGQSLLATTTHGLQEQGRAAPIRVGSGFAGRIALTREPATLEKPDSTTAAESTLWRGGISVLLGVPLVIADELLGVLQVGRVEDRPFGTEETTILRAVADRVAAAVQTRRLVMERSVAALLERSLRPSRLPRCEPLDLAACYLTPEERSVGGDWYDVFVGPRGELWVVIGDVVGHGLSAAVVMGRVKSAFRAYTLITESPAEALRLTDRKVLHFEVGSMVTLACAVSFPPYREFRLSLAGHLPPVRARQGFPAELTVAKVDPPLGYSAALERTTTVIQTPPGSLLLFYTDGLVERRGEGIDEGLERLRSVVRVESAQSACTRALDHVLAGYQATDDVAIVAVNVVS